MQKNKAKT